MNSKVLLIVCGVVIAFGVWQVASSSLVSGPGGKPGGFRILNVETGHRSTMDMPSDFGGWPVACPDTGDKTCYPAEICLSEKCRATANGTWVVLNSYVGKAGQTKCPVCGEVVMMGGVVGDERPPQDDKSAKPTKPRGRRGRRGG